MFTQLLTWLLAWQLAAQLAELLVIQLSRQLVEPEFLFVSMQLLQLVERELMVVGQEPKLVVA